MTECLEVRVPGICTKLNACPHMTASASPSSVVGRKPHCVPGLSNLQVSNSVSLVKEGKKMLLEQCLSRKEEPSFINEGSCFSHPFGLKNSLSFPQTACS